MFGQDTSTRELIVIGRDAKPPNTPDDAHITAIACPTDRLGDIAMTLRLLLRGRPLQAEDVAGIPITQLGDIVTRLADAHYGVIAWAASELDFPHAELAVQAFCGLVKELNTTTRCSGLPLGGNDGDYTFSQVATWQAGFATRISLANGCPQFDPIQYNWERLLESDEADLLLWISAFDTGRTPPSYTPSIVLGRAGMQCEAEPDVFIPVATPGIDHAGHLYRCDSAVAIPLRSLRDSHLPEVSRVLHAITDGL
jgi:formylmethanofuran dehydrogenase subunit B